MQLAEKAGVSRGTIDNWKTQPRSPHPATVKSVAERLDIDYFEALELAGIPARKRSHRESSDQIAAGVDADLAEIGDMLRQMLEKKRGRPLTENQRRVTSEWADTLERTIDAMDEETG